MNDEPVGDDPRDDAGGSGVPIQNGEVLLYNMHISPYDQGNIWNHEPLRTRKLLLHRGEIGRLAEKSQAQGLTLVPLRIGHG